MAPLPFLFDHIIVQAKVSNRTVWLDGTRRYQGTRLNRLGTSDYGFALTLASEKDGGGLTPMALADDKMSQRRVIERFIADNYAEPARFEVETVYEGMFAEQERASLAERGRSSIEKQYLDYQVGRYDSLRLAGPLVVEDDSRLNRLVTREYYEIDGFLTLEDGWWVYGIDMYGIDDVLKYPQRKQRKGPAVIGVPGRYLSMVSVTLPEAADFPLEPGFSLRFPFARYQYDMEKNGRTLTATQSLRLFSDRILAEQSGALETLENAISDRQWISYQFEADKPAVVFLKSVMSKVSEVLLEAGSVAVGLQVVKPL